MVRANQEEEGWPQMEEDGSGEEKREESEGGGGREKGHQGRARGGERGNRHQRGGEGTEAKGKQDSDGERKPSSKRGRSTRGDGKRGGDGNGDGHGLDRRRGGQGRLRVLDVSQNLWCEICHMHRTHPGLTCLTTRRTNNSLQLSIVVSHHSSPFPLILHRELESMTIYDHHAAV